VFGAGYNWVDGAADCTVVKVVVNERTECAGDEKVLPSPPPCELNPPPPVAIVPALEYPASEIAVSPLVDTVGAVDLALVVGF
jgi:hypothetical protein